MTPNRPLKELSEDELMNLWDEAINIAEIGSKDFDYTPLGMSDVRNLRTEIMLLAALCEKYGLDYPKLKPDCLFVDRADIDDNEEEYEEPLEYITEPLHHYIDAFSDVDGIGDFTSEYLLDPVEVAAALRKDGSEIKADDVKIENLSEEYRDLVGDELNMSGYRSLVALIAESGEPEYYFQCMDITLVRSKNLGKLVLLAEQKKLSAKVAAFVNDFSVQLSRAAYFSLTYDDMYEITDDGEYAGVACIVQYCEDEVWTCSLHKNMFDRIGAFIATELAARY